jgi:hypothetical protein
MASAVAQRDNRGFPRKQLIRAILHPVLAQQTERGIRWQGRIRILAREHRDLLKRMEEAGLIMPLPPSKDMDRYDIDPVAAWYEWQEYARSCADEEAK